MKKNWTQWLTGLFLIGLCNLAFAVQIAGTIEFVEGDAHISDAQGTTRPAQTNGAISQSDTLMTGSDGEIHIRMADSGYIAMRPNTLIKIETYLHEGDENDSSVISLMKGTFRSITGWIGKYNPKNYAIKTPSATIGIRGTDHEPMFIPEPASEEHAVDEPGTYDKVNEGESFIKNPQGETAIQPNSAGFVPHHGRHAPKLLAHIPSWFKAARNERLIEKRRAFLREHLENRVKKIKEIRERNKHKRTDRFEERRKHTQNNREQRESSLSNLKEKRKSAFDNPEHDRGKNKHHRPLEKREHMNR